MNIDRVNQNLAAGAYGARRAKGTEKGKDGSETSSARGASSASQGDGVELSDQARFAARVNAAVKGAPDVRESLVAELRQRLQDGTYKVDDGELARRLLGQGEA
jgi:negative regulator of flagellin synthesis FlgM